MMHATVRTSSKTSSQTKQPVHLLVSNNKMIWPPEKIIKPIRKILIGSYQPTGNQNNTELIKIIFSNSGSQLISPVTNVTIELTYEFSFTSLTQQKSNHSPIGLHRSPLHLFLTNHKLTFQTSDSIFNYLCSPSFRADSKNKIMINACIALLLHCLIVFTSLNSPVTPVKIKCLFANKASLVLIAFQTEYHSAAEPVH